MAGDSEAGKCEICQQESLGLARKYYHYNVTCTCCGGKENNHFEFVRHCNNCTPVPPKKIIAHVEPIEE